MRFVVFQGGLGNQIFQYLFFLYLKRTLGYSHVYPFLYGAGLKGHNGWELNKWFKTEALVLPKCQVISTFFVRCLKKIRLLPVITEELFRPSFGIYLGYWQNKKYFSDNVDSLAFSEFNLNRKNNDLLAKIRETNSVSIHIRRGDYLLDKFAPIYGNVCTKAYYQEAISYINKSVETPFFYVFSDDMEWVKDNLNIKNAVYVDWNTGLDSFYDLYLMSLCQHHIIANSSFSFWGARLSKSQNGINIYPSKWYNSTYEAPDIFPEKWIGIMT